jgi:ABC-2 type transport system ATP-binding protein
MMMSSPAIQVENLCKQYGPVLAVDHVNFEVQPGELVGFLGPNGAGKSTTMRILTTWLPASSGMARVCGHDVLSESMQVRENIGYLPESVPLYQEMRVEEYLHYRAKLKGVHRTRRHVRIEESLERCRIREVRRRLLGTLSKGYRQRVGLADALLADPKVIILDEPTSGLDPIQIRETLNTIKDLANTHAVLFSTHILTEVEAICDRVMIIARGTLRWDGYLSDLDKRNPTLLIEVRCKPEELKDSLISQSGVVSMKHHPQDDGWTLFEIETDSAQDPRVQLVNQIRKTWYELRRIEVRKPRLEDLYLDVVLRSSSKV